MDLALQIVIGLLLLLIGAILGAVLNVYFKRPKLAIAGGGGGGGPGPGFRRNYITILNESGQFGLNIRETVILGKRIHGRIDRGLVFDRLPARECRARIYDKKSGEPIKGLWWRVPNTSSCFVQEMTLNSGERAELMLFARLNDEPSKYFVFEPSDGPKGAPVIPSEESKFQETRAFVVEIRYFHGKKVFSTDVEMRRGFDGRLSFKRKTGGSSF